MVVVRDGKKYYTIEESKERMSKYIEESAEELIQELRKRNKHKEKSYV